ncbi:MAG: hypothetical protein M1828_004718 [Chrysothrix sp. TS-e1954]|nr:MAG: hypothetical protein M1828_004718 [Chrysothrix sp. TS-e1954]
MLDDCKGPRFEELLCSLSTAVLQKATLIRQQQQHPPRRLAWGRAIAKQLTTDDEISIDPLIFAHKSALKASLAARRQHDGRARGIERVLKEHKQRVAGCSARLEESKEQLEQDLRHAEVDSTVLKKQLRHNCTGDHTWLSLALSGDSAMDRRPLIESRFGDIWASASRETPFADPQRESSLLSDLEQRVEEQRLRLGNWREFQSQVSKRNEALVVQRSPSKTPGRSPSKSMKSTPYKSPRKPSRPPISNRSSGKQPHVENTIRRTQDHEYAATEDNGMSTLYASRELSAVVGASPSAIPQNLQPVSSNHSNPAQKSVSDSPPFGKHSPLLEKQQPRRLKPMSGMSDLHHFSEDACAAEAEQGRFEADPSASPGDMRTKPILRPSQYDRDHDKVPSSLEQRTRQSMALQSSLRPQQTSRPPTTHTGSSRRTPSPVKAADPPQETPMALNERTRQTLAQSADLGRTKSHRRSKSTVEPRQRHAVNPWTNEEPFESLSVATEQARDGVDGGVRTPEKDLFDPEVDCDSIFKPRHRIRHSPPGGSPAP